MSDAWVQTRADGLVVSDATVFWSVGCGDEFSPAQSEVGSRPIAGGPEHRHFRSPDCLGDRVASASVAVDEEHIFWLTGDGRVVALARNATAGAPHTVSDMQARPLGVWPRLSSIAALGAHVYWTEAGSVHRAPKAGGARQLVASVPEATSLRHLAVLDDRHLVCLDSTRRLVRIPSEPGGRPQVIGERLSCFAVGGGRLVWAGAEEGSAITQVVSSRLMGDDIRTHHRTDGTVDSRREDAIDALAIDAANIFAHERRNVTGGPIMRIPLDEGPPVSITDHVLGNVPLAVGDGAVFYTDFNAGIYRLDTGAGPRPRPGGVSITGAEVVQTVQTIDGRIPLLAGKRTFVRVYVRGREDGRGAWAGVTARVHVAGFGRSHAPVNAYTITASPSGSDRRTLDDSFVFELDPEETRVGDRSYTVTVHPPPGRPTDDPAPQQRFAMRFEDSGPARSLRYYGVRYGFTNVPAAAQRERGLSGPMWGPRTTAEQEMDRRCAEGYLPVSALRLERWPGDPVVAFDYTGITTDAALEVLRAWADRMLASRPVTDPVKRMVITQPEANGFLGYCVPLADGKYRINLQSPVDDPGNVLAHELLHSLTLQHTPDLMGYGGGSDSGFPRADGSMGPEVGISSEPLLHVVPGTDADGRVAKFDVMSYQHSGSQPMSWTSPYSYCKAMRASTAGGVNPTGVDGLRP